ncbi:hypothetical protein H4R19_001322 [Coemansia spiralis]|nr:hypothetical protein H4R19_001322 [Coemansia spiralis]
MKVFAAVLAVAAVVVAQEVGSDAGTVSSSGATSIDHKNENNGKQTTNSLTDEGNKGGNKFENLQGNHFSDSASNTGMSDTVNTNGSKTSTSGNDGDTANGDSNKIGAPKEERKRDTTFRIRGSSYF